HLAARAANHQALTPLDFLARSQEAFAERPAVAWRERVWNYRQFAQIVARMAHFLKAQGVGDGDVVSIISTNRPEMLAAHYAVPLLGAVLNSINTRLDSATISYILEHSESRLFLIDPACQTAAETAAQASGVAVHLIGEGDLELLADRAPLPLPDHRDLITDEWRPICLNYTSGTTGKPKGV
ncbi:MAG: AMP-binding protein, partial [Elsteraceae bacterium]